jgi:hypothetical protein
MEIALIHWLRPAAIVVFANRLGRFVYLRPQWFTADFCCDVLALITESQASSSRAARRILSPRQASVCDLSGAHEKPQRLIVADCALLDVAQNRRQMVLAPYRSVRIGGIAWHYRFSATWRVM